MKLPHYDTVVQTIELGDGVQAVSTIRFRLSTLDTNRGQFHRYGDVFHSKGVWNALHQTAGDIHAYM